MIRIDTLEDLELLLRVMLSTSAMALTAAVMLTLRHLFGRRS